MKLRKMIQEATSRGRTDEGKMWLSVEALEPLLEKMEMAHPEEYWKFMREQHRILYDGHYSPEFAEWDVAQMHSTDRNGNIREGAHWTKDEVLQATEGMSFPSGVNDCDKWVAMNGAWHDFNKKFSDDQILEIGYSFFFDDEDWDGDTKVWDYFSMR